MADDRSRGEIINTWAQTAALCLGGIWAIYTFVYKEWYLPEISSPALSLNITMETKGQRNGILAIESTFTLTNHGTKAVDVLTGAYAIYGRNVVNDRKSRDDYYQDLNTLWGESKTDFMRSFSVKLEASELAAAGKLFSGWTLAPGETGTKSSVHYIPADAYDALELDAYFPIVDVIGADIVARGAVGPKGLLGIDLRRTSGESVAASRIRETVPYHYQLIESRKVIPLWK